MIYGTSNGAQNYIDIIWVPVVGKFGLGVWGLARGLRDFRLPTVPEGGV